MKAAAQTTPSASGSTAFESKRAFDFFARPHDEPPRIGSLLKSAPFSGRIVDLVSHDYSQGRSDYVIAIPVRDEAELLPRCLASLRRAMAATSTLGTVVVVVNGSTDESAQVVVDWLLRHAVAGLVVEVAFDLSIQDAPHARRLALDIAAQFAPDGVLLTTDADSYVGTDWIDRALASIERGFDLVCDDVRLDESEASSLPKEVGRIGELERAYVAACIDLWRLWTGTTDDPVDTRASGAGMAIRTSAYTAVGGLPLPRHGEDRALRSIMRQSGFRTMTSLDCGTRTSARLDARAAGGCGETLRQRAVDPDPVCDGSLVPVAQLMAIARGDRSLSGSLPASSPMRASELRRQFDIAVALLTEAGLRP